jgi:hypothetical protein
MSDTTRRLATFPGNQQVATTAPTALSPDMLNQIVAATEERLRDRPPSPFAISSWEQLIDFANKSARSQLIPESYRGKPDDIVIAVMLGQEIGLPPIQSIQSIAVVNGRPSLWGEAVPGLCLASGKVLDYHEAFEGQEGTDVFTAVCTVHRKGLTKPHIGRFSVGDAKIAGLYGKRVHATYPKQMLMWRARHQAWHAAFPDILRGIATRELEAETEMVNAEPKFSSAPPERSWYQNTPTETLDGWDNTWFLGWEQQLINEPNGYKWAEKLKAALAAAPTKRDIEEIGDLPVVVATLEKAPPDMKEQILDAFGDARSRFRDGPVVRRRATFADEFAYPLLDYDGTPVSEQIYTDPLTFARAAAEHSDAMTGNALEAFLIENEQALGAACIDPGAAAIVERMRRQPETDTWPGDTPDAPDSADEEAEPVQFEAVIPPVDRGGKGGGKDWRVYPKMIADRLKTLNPAYLEDWVLAQRDTMADAPAPVRLHAIEIIRKWATERRSPAFAAAADILNGLIQPAAPAVSQPQPPTEDPDTKMVRDHMTNLARLRTLAETNAKLAAERFALLRGLDEVNAALARLHREKPTMYTTLATAFAETETFIVEKAQPKS